MFSVYMKKLFKLKLRLDTWKMYIIVIRTQEKKISKKTSVNYNLSYYKYFIIYKKNFVN